MRNRVRWTRLAAAVTVPFAVATACGTSDSGSPAAPPPTTAGTAAETTTAAATTSTQPPKTTQRDQTWTAVDPCALLRPGQLTPFLANTPAKPSRADAEGKHVCAWGDGEFRSVRLSVWQPASAGELTRDAVRQVSIGGKKAQVVRDAEYSCEIQVGDGRMAVNLAAVSMDKIDLCPATTTALTAVVGKLPW